MATYKKVKTWCAVEGVIVSNGPFGSAICGASKVSQGGCTECGAHGLQKCPHRLKEKPEVKDG